MIEIIEVKTKKQLKTFARFPADVLYRNCKLYVPSIYSDELMVMDKKKNFSLANCDVRCWLAYKDGKVAGRIAGIIQRKYNRVANEKCIRFSRFDCIDDIEVATGLLNAVEQFGIEQGMNTMHGPWGFNDQDREGLLTYGFDRRATYATNYNYEYYEKLVKENGFSDEAEWVEYDFTLPEAVDPRIVRISQRVKEKFQIKELCDTMSLKEIVKKYGHKAVDMMNKAYSVLDCYVELEGKEIDNLFDQFVTIINPRYFSLLVNKDDEVIGMGVVLPSIADALIKCRGKLFPTGFIGLLKAISKPKELEMAIVAVRPDYQKLGINSIIFNRILQNIIDDGIPKIESNPELVTNVAVQSQWETLEHRLIKRRKTFVKIIGGIIE